MTDTTNATVLPTEREFLVAKGLAQPTRGRFSKDAVAALVEARANGQEFRSSKPAPAPRKQVSLAKPPVAAAPAAPKVALPEVNPKEVRSWAKANGHVVGDRGRIHGSIVTAFLASGGQPVGERAKRPTPLDMPKRVRTQTVAWALVQPRKSEGSWATPFVLGVEKCGKGHSISTCACAVPTTTATFGNTPLTFSKPVV